MDIGIVRGLLTAVLLILFLGVWAWSWSRKRGADFDAASRVPLEESSQPPQENNNTEQLS